jgi:hypothetical protein
MIQEYMLALRVRAVYYCGKLSLAFSVSSSGNTRLVHADNERHNVVGVDMLIVSVM